MKSFIIACVLGFIVLLTSCASVPLAMNSIEGMTPRVVVVVEELEDIAWEKGFDVVYKGIVQIKRLYQKKGITYIECFIKGVHHNQINPDMDDMVGFVVKEVSKEHVAALTTLFYFIHSREHEGGVMLFGYITGGVITVEQLNVLASTSASFLLVKKDTSI